MPTEGQTVWYIKEDIIVTSNGILKTTEVIELKWKEEFCYWLLPSKILTSKLKENF